MSNEERATAYLEAIKGLADDIQSNTLKTTPGEVEKLAEIMRELQTTKQKMAARVERIAPFPLRAVA